MKIKFIIILLFYIFGIFSIAITEEISEDLKEEFLLWQYELEVITASKHKQKLSEAPSTITVITAKDIERLGVADLTNVFRMSTGLDVMTAYDNGVFVVPRGLLTFQSAKVLLLIDGQRVNHDFTGSIMWKDLPILLEDIEHIEIVRGPGSALYGANAFAGIIHIITKNPNKKPASSFRISIGEKDTYIYSLSYTGQKGKLGYGNTAAK